MWGRLTGLACLSFVVGSHPMAFAGSLEVQLTGPAVVIVWKTPDAMTAGQELRFSLIVTRHCLEVARYPGHVPLSLIVPDRDRRAAE